jgi:hypothetical protein
MEGQEPGDLEEPLAQHEHPLLIEAALPARVDALFRSWDTGVPKAGIKTRQRLAVASRSLPALRLFRPISQLGPVALFSQRTQNSAAGVTRRTAGLT